MGSYYETFAAPYALTRVGPPIPEPKTDAELEAAVERRLGTLAGVVDLSKVEIQVTHGIVALKGAVPTDELRRALARFADHTLGVRGVENLLLVS